MRTIDPPLNIEQQLREMNDALLVSSVHQHELTEQAEQGEQSQRELTEKAEQGEQSQRKLTEKAEQGEQSQRKLTENAQRAESLIECQKESLELIVKGEPIERVLDFLARSMESQSQGKFLVAIHLMESDGHHFGYVAAPSLPASYAQATKGMDARLELGACSSAVVSHQPSIVRAFATESRWPAFTAAVVSLGLRGCFTTPILSSDQRVLGTFAIYYREPGDPSPQDQQLVEIVMRTVAIAIERKQAESALRESEDRFRMLADNMSQFAWTADAKGWIYWYNQRWYDYTGTTLEEMQGWGWKQVHHPDHVNRVVERIQRSWDTGEPWEDTFPLRGKGGEYRWFLSRALPIRDDQGKVLRWFGTNTDVTERLEMEIQIRQQAESLADLHRRKDEFLAMLSHELRNPLAPIANAVQLLGLQQNEGQLQQQARTIIERQVGQLNRLVDDLLEVSRFTTGRIHLNLEQVALNGIVGNAVETVHPLIGQRRHALQLSLPSEPIWLHADAARLEQVVVNLLTNAAKYTEDGGHIWLSAQQEGDEAVLRVRDSGVGIPPELLPHVFDLFTQSKRSLDRSDGGLGIGLSLVQRLVKMHGGSVEVRSALDQGSEFVVRLPMMPSAATSVPSFQRLNKPTGPSLRVLAVDDNFDGARILGMLMKESGHDVRTAHDGPTAIEVALDFRPDVVLLDIGLPGLNGYEVATRLRQQPTLNGVVLIAVTGYGQDSDRQRSQEAGFDHHLVKPADYEKLQQILATLETK
ncbi:MAG: ATP-binding protein [Pirellulales bacterium]